MHLLVGLIASIIFGIAAVQLVAPFVAFLISVGIFVFYLGIFLMFLQTAQNAALCHRLLTNRLENVLHAIKVK